VLKVSSWIAPFMNCSTIRRNLSESDHFIFAPSPSSRPAMFFVDANTKTGMKERKFLNEQLEPLLLALCLLRWLKAIPRNQRRFRALVAMIWL
jgi:hypothetical protein